MAVTNIQYLPIFAFFTLGITVIVTATLSFRAKHVTYIIPFISDTGTWPIESCIFGQMLNILTVLLIVIMYIRYNLVQHIIFNQKAPIWISKLNLTSMWIGFSASFGCSIVANFQEINVPTLHWGGAIVTFTAGGVYQLTQTILSYKLYPALGSKSMNMFKFMVSIVAIVTSILFISTGLVALYFFRGEDVTKWKKEDGYMKLHIFSAVTEWISAGCVGIYIYLLHYDFHTISISEPIFSIPNSLKAKIVQK